VASEFGSKAIPPVKNGKSTLFVQRSGLVARETFYDFGSDGYESSEATVEAEHITQPGVLDMVFAPEPTPVVWAIRADGALIGFTWNNEQKVRGWHRHPVGGNGVVESLAVMQAAEGDRHELWLVVRRTIDGVTRRYVEYMERPWRRGDPQSRQFYVDSGATYSGPGTYTRSGTTLTAITDIAHGLITGNVRPLQFSDSALDGQYTVTVINPTTFTVTTAAAGTAPGTLQNWDHRRRPARSDDRWLEL
jgi:hypothetical protein